MQSTGATKSAADILFPAKESPRLDQLPGTGVSLSSNMSEDLPPTPTMTRNKERDVERQRQREMANIRETERSRTVNVEIRASPVDTCTTGAAVAKVTHRRSDSSSDPTGASDAEILRRRDHLQRELAHEILLPPAVGTQPKQSSFDGSFERSTERTRRVSDLMTPRPFNAAPNTIKSVSQVRCRIRLNNNDCSYALFLAIRILLLKLRLALILLL